MKLGSQFVSNERSIVITRPLAFLDLETTGVVLGFDRIVEIGILKITPDGKQETYETRLNPEMRISSEATAIHGISNQDVLDKPTFLRVANDLLNFLQECDIAGYNVLNFDIPMLSSEFQRVGIDLNMEGRKIVDVMAIFVQKEPRDLNAAYRFYCGSKYEQAHTASADARACWEVLQGQIKKYPDLPNTPDQLSAFVAEHRRTKTLDSGGWFEKRDGAPVFARGRYQGMLISEVAKVAPEYLEWMFTTGLPIDTIKVINSVLPSFGK